MASPYPDGDREKVASKLPPSLQKQLKIRCAELDLDIQDATTAAVTNWRASARPVPAIDTSGARSFSTWLPSGLYDDFKATCNERDVPFTQGLAQSIQAWLDDNPSPKQAESSCPRRIIVCNQKGGVGKTTISAGVAEAHAEEEGVGAKCLQAFVESLTAAELARLNRTREQLLSVIADSTARRPEGSARRLRSAAPSQQPARHLSYPHRRGEPGQSHDWRGGGRHPGSVGDHRRPPLRGPTEGSAGYP